MITSSKRKIQKPKPIDRWRAVKNFALGGVAGMCATSVIQPADTVKVRI